jgi:hypothetical protein
MRRVCAVTVLATCLAGITLVGGVGKATGTPPTSTFSAVLTDDGACTFTLAATWKNAKVDFVDGQWFLDGAFLLTTQAPGTGPNGGTLMGKKAVMQTGPFAATAGPHTWQVLVHFYSGGAQLDGDVLTNVDAVNCAVTGP